MPCLQAQEQGSRERLLQFLEDCHIDLLPAFYAALTEAKQGHVVELIRTHY